MTIFSFDFFLLSLTAAYKYVCNIFVVLFKLFCLVLKYFFSRLIYFIHLRSLKIFPQLFFVFSQTQQQTPKTMNKQTDKQPLLNIVHTVFDSYVIWHIFFPLNKLLLFLFNIENLHMFCFSNSLCLLKFVFEMREFDKKNSLFAKC